MVTDSYTPAFRDDYETDLLYPPGALLDEELKARKLSQTAFAQRLGWTRGDVTSVIHARRPLTPDMAAAIARELGTSAELWLNLEAAYRKALQTPVLASA